jgi:hypothetical protein
MVAEFDVDDAPVFLQVAMVLRGSSVVRARWRRGSRRQQGLGGTHSRRRGEGAAAWLAINGPWCPSVTGELKRIGNEREIEGIESVSGAGASLIFDGRGLKEGRVHDTGETGRRRRL